MKGQKKKSQQILTRKKPEKGLVLNLGKTGGRGTSGRITVRHRGGGVKRKYRVVDFGQEKLDKKGKAIALEYDPNRTAYLALIEYEDGDKRYILAANDLKIGDEIICAETAQIKNGNRIKLKNAPIGTPVFNIELEAGKGGRIVRSAGTSAKVLAQENGYTNLEMPSKEIRKVSWDCFASIGQVSHPEKRF